MERAEVVKCRFRMHFADDNSQMSYPNRFQGIQKYFTKMSDMLKSKQSKQGFILQIM